MFLLYFIGVVILLGILSVILLIPQKSFVVDFLMRKTFYFGYHVLATLFLLPLGEFGKKLHQKSFLHLLVSFEDSLVKILDAEKAKLFAGLKGSGSGAGSKRLKIMEVGIGPGSNFVFYPTNCDLTAVEPAPPCKDMVMDGLKKYEGIKLERYIPTGAEDLSQVPDGSIDVVLGTLLLCSVDNAPQVLKEIRRVLKPGGKYYFLEHIYEKPHTIAHSLQKLMNWTGVWPFWMCGCKFYDSPTAIKKAGFSKIDDKNVTLRLDDSGFLFYFVKNMYYGTATKE